MDIYKPLPLDLKKLKQTLPKSDNFKDNQIMCYWGLFDYLPTGATIVECGSHDKVSICAIADYIKYKKLEVFCVHYKTIPIIKALTKCDLIGLVTVIEEDEDPGKEALGFDEETIDLLFLNSQRTYTSIMAQISSYKDKMKEDSIICGFSDWQYNDEAMKAVKSIFGEDHNVIDTPAKGALWSGFKKDLKI